ncbi:MAG: septum formation initiator family protein [Clostridia bacterium]|nr:septum formation initiator family protein [Clostridia bacterium]
MYRKRGQNKLAMICVSLIVGMLFVVLFISRMELKQKQDDYLKREEILTQQIKDEEKRAEELVEYEKYTKTAKYVEEVAKDKLGLVYEDEIVFQPEE